MQKEILNSLVFYFFAAAAAWFIHESLYLCLTIRGVGVYIIISKRMAAMREFSPVRCISLSFNYFTLCLIATIDLNVFCWECMETVLNVLTQVLYWI